MKKLVLFFILLSQITFSQSEVFTEKLNVISKALNKVDNPKVSFEQEISSSKPGVVTYAITETSSKGKVKTKTYNFNFADIDVNTVRHETKKDIIKVQLIVKQNQKMIKETVNSEKVSYLKEIHFLALDIDNARELVKGVKEIIPISIKITKNRLSLNGYEDRLNWLTENIKNVESIKNKNEQTLELNKDYPASLIYTNLESSSKKSKTLLYNFNLSNINPNGVKFKNKGSDFIIILETKRKQKMVKFSEDGVLKNYVNKFEIVCKDVENAREIQNVLQDIIPLATQKFKEKIPKPTSLSESLTIFSKHIDVINSDKKTISQKIEGDCLSTLTNIEDTSKDKIEKQYEFYFTDLNKQKIDIEVKSKVIYVVALTNAKKRFIKHTKNNEQQNYVSKLSFACKSAEDAIIFKSTLENSIDICRKNKIKYSSDVTSLKEELKSVTLDKNTFEQKLEILEDDNLKYTQVKVSSKKSEEMIQEFKFKDINAKSVQIRISGKRVMVEFATNYQEKIIKTYKNGEIKNYTKKVSVYCNSIGNARKISEIIKNITAKNA